MDMAMRDSFEALPGSLKKEMRQKASMLDAFKTRHKIGGMANMGDLANITMATKSDINNRKFNATAVSGFHEQLQPASNSMRTSMNFMDRRNQRSDMSKRKVVALHTDLASKVNASMVVTDTHPID